MRSIKVAAVKVSYPVPASPAVTAAMIGNRRRDTRPERRIRSLLHQRGYRYRCDYQIEVNGCRVRADIVFPTRRIAIFIDGCFWHGCKAHGKLPATNTDYWGLKLASNRQRDRRVDLHLTAGGWIVVRIWEHVDPNAAAERVLNALTQDDEET